MKNLLIQKAIILDKTSPFHQQRKDILISDGIITSIENEISADKDTTEVFSRDDIYASASWVDMRANFWDPGHEQKEDLISGCEAAAYGGFTTVALLPETNSVISTKSQVEYIKSRTSNNVVDVLPVGAISPDKEHKAINEMYDLAEAGALAFSSGYRSVENYNFLLHAMQYSWIFKKKLMLFSQNKSLTGKGLVNEGVVSVQIGMRSAPALSEAIEVNNLCMLSKYANIPLHISCISTQQSLDLILKARDEGAEITADVSIQHLYYNEEALLNFDTNFKLRPPLRTEQDRTAMCQALLEYDFLNVVSDHSPHEDDCKHCEFEIADFGAATIQTVFSQLIHIYGSEKMPELTEILSSRPRNNFSLPQKSLNVGEEANITVFSPSTSWQLNNASNKSKSRNNPLWNTELKGKALAIVNKGQYKILV